MEINRPVRCSDNEALAQHLLQKRQDLTGPNGLPENLDTTLSTAYRNICSAKAPIKTLKDLSQIKGVGKWIIRLMRGFFLSTNAEDSPTKNAAKLGKKAAGPKRYMPKKNSVAYALLITLYREMINGVSFMKKQELIDAAEASGLSRVAIGPDKAKGKPGQFVSSPRDWYTGWSCMKMLISKGLVVKSSCPAKYMLTQEGQDAARECLLRSGLVDSVGTTASGSQNFHCGSHSNVSRVASADKAASLLSVDLHLQMKSSDVDMLTKDSTHTNKKSFGRDVAPDQGLNRVGMESTATCFRVTTLPLPNCASNIQCSLIDSSDSESAEFLEKDHPATLIGCTSNARVSRMDCNSGDTLHCQDSLPIGSASSSFGLRACNTLDLSLRKSSDLDSVEGVNLLAMPPCKSGEKFEEIYDVILILDDRENFGNRSRKVVDNIRSQFNILVEVRRLPVGDGIWIVRHKQYNTEYVLDFIVERKKVDDLCSSIRDNRYRDQKLRLQRCGLQKLIYLVEGDPNSLESAENIKTACFTTEILEGFDIQRTTGYADTVRKYGHLTRSIFMYYRTHFISDNSSARSCLAFAEFVKRCQDLENMTVSDVFALQLMQVPHVTEEIAIAVTDLYPTLLSLARAYTLLEGDVHAQEEMLKNRNKMISGSASRNIFKLIWGR